MTHRTPRAFPVLIGSAVCIALANVLGTTLFNVTLWITIGEKIPITKAYADVMSNLWYIVFAFSAQVFACGMGGYIAAALSNNQRYLNAMITGILLITWYIVMLATPVQVMKVDAFSMFSWFLLPVPMAILGAYIFVRMEK